MSRSIERPVAPRIRLIDPDWQEIVLSGWQQADPRMSRHRLQRWVLHPNRLLSGMVQVRWMFVDPRNRWLERRRQIVVRPRCREPGAVPSQDLPNRVCFLWGVWCPKNQKKPLLVLEGQDRWKNPDVVCVPGAEPPWAQRRPAHSSDLIDSAAGLAAGPAQASGCSTVLELLVRELAVGRKDPVHKDHDRALRQSISPGIQLSFV